jgi:hypothetical protein
VILNRKTTSPRLNPPGNGDGKYQLWDRDPSNDDSDDDSDDGDERRKVSRGDKARIRGRTPRIDDTGTRSKKLFKMEPPAKYTGETDAERTYEAVQRFLSQVSRYLRLATDVDMDGDIAEYAAAFLDGFAYRWFEALDKGRWNEKFGWSQFESAIRTKFIPRNYIQQAMKRYHAIKQNGRPVAEYIVERETLESSLGKALTKEVKASSFKEGLDREIQKLLICFADLPFEQYKRKAEVIDEETREQEAAGLLSTSGTHSILDSDDGSDEDSLLRESEERDDDSKLDDDDDDGADLDDSEKERSEESAVESNDDVDDEGSEEEPEHEEENEETTASGDEVTDIEGEESVADAYAMAAAVMDAVHRGWRY